MFQTAPQLETIPKQIFFGGRGPLFGTDPRTPLCRGFPTPQLSCQATALEEKDGKTQGDNYRGWTMNKFNNEI